MPKRAISPGASTASLYMRMPLPKKCKHTSTLSLPFSEGKSIGFEVADWDRREKFLLSLPRNLQSSLRTSLHGLTTQTWVDLCSLYNEEIDIRSRQDLHDAQINAAVKIAKGGR